MLSTSLVINMRSLEANKLLKTLYSITNPHRIVDLQHDLVRAKANHVIIDSLEDQLLKVYSRLYRSMSHSNGRTVTLVLERAEREAIATLFEYLLTYGKWGNQHFALSNRQAKELLQVIKC
jgi:hypothetical protein